MVNMIEYYYSNLLEVLFMIHMQREMQIIEILQERQCATIEYLCRRLYTSSATVRRDLTKMEEAGLIKRIRGGATLIRGAAKDTPLIVRAGKNREEKMKIANLALKYVRRANTFFMDSSSTVTELARLMGDFRDKSVMSNGIDTVNVLNEFANISVYSTGGIIQNRSSMVGDAAMNAVSKMCVDVFFFSCCGVSADKGVTDATEQTAIIKRKMLKNSGKKILLADSSKINSVFFCKACEIDDIDVIVTDKCPDEQFLGKINCEIVYP